MRKNPRFSNNHAGKKKKTIDVNNHYKQTHRAVCPNIDTNHCPCKKQKIKRMDATVDSI